MSKSVKWFKRYEEFSKWVILTHNDSWKSHLSHLSHLSQSLSHESSMGLVLVRVMWNAMSFVCSNQIPFASNQSWGEKKKIKITRLRTLSSVEAPETMILFETESQIEDKWVILTLWYESKSGESINNHNLMRQSPKICLELDRIKGSRDVRQRLI